MSVRLDVEALRGIPIFAECDGMHLQLLAFSSEAQQFNVGEAIMVQGQKGATAYVVLSGEVSLTFARGERAESAGSAGPGAFLGEVSMIGEMPYSLTATALTNVMVAKISRSLFMRIAEEFPEFGAVVFKMLARKLDGSISAFAMAQDILDKAKSFSDL